MKCHFIRIAKYVCNDIRIIFLIIMIHTLRRIFLAKANGGISQILQFTCTRTQSIFQSDTYVDINFKTLPKMRIDANGEGYIPLTSLGMSQMAYSVNIPRNGTGIYPILKSSYNGNVFPGRSFLLGGFHCLFLDRSVYPVPQ
jgi:hypothetical protein